LATPDKKKSQENLVSRNFDHKFGSRDNLVWQPHHIHQPRPSGFAKQKIPVKKKMSEILLKVVVTNCLSLVYDVKN
jgi:hypothetical protein